MHEVEFRPSVACQLSYFVWPLLEKSYSFFTLFIVYSSSIGQQVLTLFVYCN